MVNKVLPYLQTELCVRMTAMELMSVRLEGFEDNVVTREASTAESAEELTKMFQSGQGASCGWNSRLQAYIEVAQAALWALAPHSWAWVVCLRAETTDHLHFERERTTQRRLVAA